MFMNNLQYLPLPILAGFILAVQMVVEVKNRDTFGNQISIAVIAFFTAFTASLLLALFCVLCTKKNPIPSFQELASADWYLYLGGFARVAYLALMIWAMPKLGAGKSFCAAVSAQLFTMVWIDHYGCFGSQVDKVGWQKLLGCGMVAAGAFLVMVKK